MPQLFDPEAARLIADSRVAVEASRRLIAQCKRDREAFRALMDESRRLLEASRQPRERQTVAPAASPPSLLARPPRRTSWGTGSVTGRHEHYRS